MATSREENLPNRKASALRPGPILPRHSVQHYEDQHAWVIDQALIPCSVAEYHCLKLLLEHANRCVPFASFLSMQEIFPTVGADAKQERLRVAHMMSVLRTKIWASDLDIVSVMNIGYILLSELQESSPSEVCTVLHDDRSNEKPDNRNIDETANSIYKRKNE